MNRIDELFRKKNEKVLSVYFTAGYPYLGSVEEIITLIEKNGGDMVEIGMPYSDPLADGPVIQETGKIAIANGMTVRKLFGQLAGIRKKSSIPLLLMGYFNPVMQFGFENFCRAAAESGIDGLIIPDLPLYEYEKYYHNTVEENGLKNIFLITPETPDERIRKIDEVSSGFIYLVSSSSTTGKTQKFGEEQVACFKRVKEMNLQNPVMAGFGIYNRETLEQAWTYCNGAITGSALMREFKKGRPVSETIENFFHLLKS
jgi:tryptophan synthase alpha chain